MIPAPRATHHAPRIMNPDFLLAQRREFRARRAFYRSIRTFYHNLAWLAVFNAAALLCIAIGVLLASTNNLLLNIVAGLALLAGLQGAHYLITRS